MIAPLRTPPAETIEVGEGAITLAVLVDRGRLVVVLRARADIDIDIVVRIPVSDTDAQTFTRVLAGPLRRLHPAPDCPACGHQPRPSERQKAQQ